jgi:SAM-dependent methyltransferase
MQLPRLASNEEFATLHGYLANCGFDEPTLRELLGLGSLSELVPAPENPVKLREALNGVPFPLRVLVYVFLLGGRVPEDVWRQWVPEASRNALLATQLVEPDPAHSGCLWSPVAFYPVRGLYLASDRSVDAEGEQVPVGADYVFSGISQQSMRFVEGIPTTPCDEFLDLGTGCGVAALLAAKNFAKNALALDITERSVWFTEFNRRLNGLENVRALRGDLYQPVEGMTFDRIVSHPPYIPTLGEGLVFASGGDDGEHITRRVVESLARFLRPGGCFHGLAMVSDRRNRPFEQRLREWLGAAQAWFNVLLFVRESITVPRYISDQICIGAPGFREYEPWKERFDGWGVERLNYSYFVIHRSLETDGGFTLRRQCGPLTRASEMEWTRECQLLVKSARQDWLWEAGLRISPWLQLLTRSKPVEGVFREDLYEASTSYPAVESVEGPEGVRLFLETCGAGRTGREIYLDLQTRGLVHQESKFVELAVRFLASGLIESDALPFPAYPRKS